MPTWFYFKESIESKIFSLLFFSRMNKNNDFKVLHMVLLREPQEELMAREYKGAMALFQDREKGGIYSFISKHLGFDAL